MTKKYYLFHPFLFSILPAVFLWGQNFGEVPLREVLPTLAVLVVFGGIVWCFLWIFFRVLEKLAIVSSISLAMVLCFGYIYEIFFYNSIIKLRWRWTLVIFFLIFVVMCFLVRRTKKNLVNVNKAMVAVVGTFILISLFQVAWGYYNTYTDKRHSDVNTVADDSPDQLRDIYYIILDGYSSLEVAKNVIGYKEKEEDLISFLGEKGFFIADKSESNYPDTLFSIPSSLNMVYLQDPLEHKRHFTMAEDNRVKDILKSYGYKYYHFGADAFTFFNRYADENVNIGMFTPYQEAVWYNTLFRPIQDLTNTRFEGLADKFGFLDLRMTQWKRERYKLKRLAEISDEENSPIFAFAHFLVPKGAGVFDENGNFVTEEEEIAMGPIKSYIGQVAYINKEIEKLTTALLEKSGPRPIIIIQGDHGFPFWAYRDRIDEMADPARAKELIVPGKYSFPIFNVYYFPDEGDQLLYNTITPVNTFRVLFSYYFGQNFELLDDKNYTQDPDDSSKFIIWDK